MRKFVWSSVAIALLAGGVYAEEAGVEGAAVEVADLKVEAVEPETVEYDKSAVEYTTLEVQSEGVADDVVTTDAPGEEFVKPDRGRVDGECADHVCTGDDCLDVDAHPHYVFRTLGDSPSDSEAEILTFGAPEVAGQQILMMMSSTGVNDSSVQTLGGATTFGLDQLSAEQRTAEHRLGHAPATAGRFNPLARLFGRKPAPVATGSKSGAIQQVSGTKLTPAQRDRMQQLAAIDRIRDRALSTGDKELLKKADRMEADLRGSMKAAK